MNENMPNCMRRLQAAQVLMRNRRPINEVFCFAEAFEECSVALKEFGELSTHDADVDLAIWTVRRTIDCHEITVWDQRGKHFARADMLSPVERAVFEEAVDRILRFLGSSAGKRFLRGNRQEGSAA